MYCKNCGTNNESNSQFCSNCGASLANEQPVVTSAPVYNAAPVAQPGKGLAIAGMVCGIVSFFCFGVILGILAIIFGGVAKSKGYRGGMATAGIACGAIGLALWVIMLILGGGIAGFMSLAGM